MGELVYPDAKYVEWLESGAITWPRSAYRNILAELCGRPVVQLGFTPPLHSRTAGDAAHGRINESLRDALSASGMEVTELARKVGVDPKTAQRWITNGRIPHARHRWKASQILGRGESELWSYAFITQGLPSDRPFALDAAFGYGPRALTNSSADALAAAENLRQAMTEALANASKPDIEYLAEGVLQHARDSIQTPPGDMLPRLLCDHNEVRLLMSDRLHLGQLRNLYQISAQLSSLIADELMVLGKPVHANSWHQLARYAADETEDDTLRALVRTLAAMVPLYYGDAPETLRLSREAQTILRGKQHMARALAPMLESLACAQMGDKKSACSALNAARESFEQLGSHDQADSVFGFSERRFRFYESRLLSQLGEIGSEIEAQERALALYPLEIVGDRCLIELDKASCMIRAKDIAVGLRMAGDVPAICLECHIGRTRGVSKPQRRGRVSTFATQSSGR